MNQLHALVNNLKERETRRTFRYASIGEILNEYCFYGRSKDSEGEFIYIIRPHDKETLFKLTRHAFNQLCAILSRRGKFTVTPKYLWENPKSIDYNLKMHIVDYYADSANEEPIEVLLNIHDEIVVNGVLSSSYVGVSNLEVMEYFVEQCYAQNMTPASVDVKFYDDYFDSMRCVILFEQFVNDGNLYGAGVLILNSQNGTVGLTIQPIVKSTACDNSITMFTNKWYHRHTGNLDNFLEEALDNLGEYVQISVDLYHAYHNMRQIVVENMDEEIDKIMALYKIPKKYRQYFLEGLTSEYSDVENTVFGLVSGLTFMAQMLPDIKKEQALVEHASQIIMEEMSNLEKGNEVYN